MSQNTALLSADAATTVLPPAKRIASLDGFRAVAILMVIACHWIASCRLQSALWDGLANWLGLTGVSIFFVLSGFLITHLLLEEIDKCGCVSLSRFYLRRAFRILPPLYLFLSVVFLLQRAGVLQLPTREIVYAAMFVFNYAPAGNTWILHTWSLSVEEQFYLFWPILLVFAGPSRSRWIALALICLTPIVRVITLIELQPNHYLVDRMWMLAHTRLDMLMFGCALALFRTTPRFQTLINQFVRSGGVPISLVTLLVITPMMHLLWPKSFMNVAGYSLTGIAVTTCIHYFVRNPRSAVGGFLNAGWITHLGVLSYSIYLWQELFFNEKNKTLAGALPWSIVFTLAIAEFSYWCIERPSLRLRDRVFSKRRSATRADHPNYSSPILVAGGRPPRLPSFRSLGAARIVRPPVTT